MKNNVYLSEDGSYIHFTRSEILSNSVKKFRQSTEIKDFYHFILKNNLQKEAHEILLRISAQGKSLKSSS